VVSLVQIPGLYIGCTPLNSLLKSNLQCFYDSQCLTYLFNRTYIEPLNNQIELSNYSLNTSIETLVEHLFIEMDFSRVHLDNNVIVKRICIALNLMIILFLLPRNVYYKDQNKNIAVNMFMDWQG